MIIVYSCPVHGDLVEYDPPGPQRPPDYCWKRMRIPRAIHTCACNKRLERSERE